MTPTVRKFKNTFFPRLGHLSMLNTGTITSSPWADKPNTPFVTEQYESTDNLYSQILLGAIAKVTTPEDSILDVCCNQGRYLRALWERGYRKLYGFDIMKSAIDTFYKKFGSKMKDINLTHASFNDFFSTHSTNNYDFAITMSATLELIGPQERIFKKISKAVNKGAVFILAEDLHAYPRFWSYCFEKNGLQVLIKQKIETGGTLFILAKEPFVLELTKKLTSIHVDSIDSCVV